MKGDKIKYRTLIAAAVTALIMLCLCGCAEKPDMRDTVVYIESGIRHPDDSWEPYKGGTGFFVGRSGEAPVNVVTRAQITDIKTAVEGNPEIRVYTGDGHITADIAVSDIYRDIAVLRLTRPAENKKPLKLCVPDIGMIGGTVYIAGHQVGDLSADEKTDVVIKEKKTERIYTEAGSNIRKIKIEGFYAGNMPGAPVINENGSVIGICGGTISVLNEHEVDIKEPETAEYAESIEVVKIMLDNNLIAAETEAAFPIIPVIIIAVSVLVALFIILVVIRVIAKKKNPPRIQANGQGPIPTASSDPSGDSGYRIECTSGALAGKKIMIKTSGAIVIGSKAGMCSVAIPGNPAGVGSRHCEIWFNGTDVCIRDAGSPHGTLLSSGKLSANETAVLKEGDVFTIGTDEQTFTIRKKKS